MAFDSKGYDNLKSMYPLLENVKTIEIENVSLSINALRDLLSVCIFPVSGMSRGVHGLWTYVLVIFFLVGYLKI